MNLGKIICWLRGCRVRPGLDFTEPGEIRCIRCNKLLSTVPPEDPPLAPIYDKSYTNGCRDKTRFASQEEADARMDRMKVRPATLHSYHCEHCQGWHLGNSKVRDKRRGS
jgi:hypothetical protein